MLFSATTAIQNAPQVSAAMIVCVALGKKMNVNPRPFAMAAKLDTQNGMQKKRMICHFPRLVGANGNPVVLNSKPRPIMEPIPSDVSHKANDGSKYQAAV